MYNLGNEPYTYGTQVIIREATVFSNTYNIHTRSIYACAPPFTASTQAHVLMSYTACCKCDFTIYSLSQWRITFNFLEMFLREICTHFRFRARSGTEHDAVCVHWHSSCREELLLETLAGHDAQQSSCKH